MHIPSTSTATGAVPTLPGKVVNAIATRPSEASVRAIELAPRTPPATTADSTPRWRSPVALTAGSADVLRVIDSIVEQEAPGLTPSTTLPNPDFSSSAAASTNFGAPPTPSSISFGSALPSQPADAANVPTHLPPLLIAAVSLIGVAAAGGAAVLLYKKCLSPSRVNRESNRPAVRSSARTNAPAVPTPAATRRPPAPDALPPYSAEGSGTVAASDDIVVAGESAGGIELQRMPPPGYEERDPHPPVSAPGAPA